MELISKVLVRKAMELVGTLDACVDDFIHRNLKQMVAAALGIDTRDNRICSANGFKGALQEIVCARAQARAREMTTPEVLARVKEELKEYVVKALKASVTDRYNDAYATEMQKLLKQAVIIDQTELRAQAEAVIAEGSKTMSAASKAMLSSYVLAAKGNAHDERR